MHVPLKSLIHTFNKVNQVSHKDGSDTWECTKCGIKGKRPMLADYIICSAQSEKKVKYCNTIKSTSLFVHKRIKVTYCTAVGNEFNEVIPGSVHYTIKPPIDFYDDSKGVWVMGISEPIKLLINEFNFAPMKRTKR